MLDRRIGATTPRYAVLGESLQHTWSPYIHNSLFLATNRDAVYLPITIPREQLASAVDVFRSCFAGFNVTIPYKERIIPLLDEVDDAVRACGAVNTVENRDGRLIGHITDGLGMLRAIEECGISVEMVSVLILGAGGAARVAGYEFLKRGGHVTFAVRNYEKGVALARELADSQMDGMSRIAVCGLDSCLKAQDILINCTPVGMFPKVNDSPVSQDVIRRCASVFDAVYNPRETRLLRSAKEARIPTIEGLGMLFYQAVEAQKYWLGSQEIASVEIQRAVYSALQKQM